MGTIRSWTGTVLVVISLTGATNAGDDTSWAARAKTEGKAAYREYEALSSRLEETTEHRLTKGPGQEAVISSFHPQTFRRRQVRLGDEVLNETVRVLDETPDQSTVGLECQCADYSFTLRKSNADAPYAVTEYAPGKRKNSPATAKPGLHKLVYNNLGFCLAAIEGSDDKFTLRALRYDDTRQLLRVDFSLNGKDPARYSVYVEPDHGWRVVEIERNGPPRDAPAWHDSTRISYGVQVDGVDLPTEYSSSSVNTKFPPNVDVKIRVLSVKVTDKTSADFRLAAFGFPEPPEFAPPSRPTPWYLWILAAAGLCGVLALGFGYLHRRWTPPAAIPGPEGAPP